MLLFLRTIYKTAELLQLRALFGANLARRRYRVLFFTFMKTMGYLLIQLFFTGEYTSFLILAQDTPVSTLQYPVLSAASFGDQFILARSRYIFFNLDGNIQLLTLSLKVPKSPGPPSEQVN